MLMYVNLSYVFDFFFLIFFLAQNVKLTSSSLLSGVWMFLFIVQKEQMISLLKQEWMVSNSHIRCRQRHGAERLYQMHLFDSVCSVYIVWIWDAIT